MNVSAPPFDNKALRQAVAWALDRDEIRTVAYFGAGETGSEEVPTGSKWYDGQDPYQAGPDLDKAKALMQQGGIANGITVEYLGLPQYPELLKTGEVVQQQLKQIGINMHIKQVDVSVWFDHFSKGTYEITSAYQERTIDPDNFYSLVLKTGAPINATQYANPAVDKLIDQASAETDEAKRKTLYSQLRADHLRRRAADLRPLRDPQLSVAQGGCRARRSTRRSSCDWRTSRCSDVPRGWGAGRQVPAPQHRVISPEIARSPRPNIAPSVDAHPRSLELLPARVARVVHRGQAEGRAGAERPRVDRERAARRAVVAVEVPALLSNARSTRTLRIGARMRSVDPFTSTW